MKRDILNILEQTPLFNHLNRGDLEDLSAISCIKKYSKESIIFLEQERPLSFMIVIRGRVKVYKTDLKSNEILLHQFTPFQMIAEMPLLAGINYPASAAFQTDGELLHIDFKAFSERFFFDAKTAFSFVGSLAEKMKQLDHLINQNMVLDATARIAQYLYENERGLELMKQKELANALHIQAETLSRLLKKLVTMALIEKKGQHYKILNHEGLKALYSVD